MYACNYFVYCFQNSCYTGLNNSSYQFISHLNKSTHQFISHLNKSTHQFSSHLNNSRVNISLKCNNSFGNSNKLPKHAYIRSCMAKIRVFSFGTSMASSINSFSKTTKWILMIFVAKQSWESTCFVSAVSSTLLLCREKQNLWPKFKTMLSPSHFSKSASSPLPCWKFRCHRSRHE